MLNVHTNTSLNVLNEVEFHLQITGIALHLRRGHTEHSVRYVRYVRYAREK
jgi:hypothetical protein